MRRRSALKADSLNQQCRGQAVNQYIEDLHFRGRYFHKKHSRLIFLSVSLVILALGSVSDGRINRGMAFCKYSPIDFSRNILAEALNLLCSWKIAPIQTNGRQKQECVCVCDSKRIFISSFFFPHKYTLMHGFYLQFTQAHRSTPTSHN